MTKVISPAPDLVSEVLRSFAVRSTIFCRSDLRAPWAFRIEDDTVGKFHIVLEGSALLLCEEKEVALTGGDLVILPHGARHTLADDIASSAPRLEQLLHEHARDDNTRLSYGGDGPLTQLLCGGFSLADGIPNSTLALLPDVLHFPYEPRGEASFEPVLAALRSEVEGGPPGASAIIAKITDVLLAQALRTWLLVREPDVPVDARLILDDAVAKAVLALNNRPSEPWSVDRLATHVGLSRTALATKFRQRVGQPPMRYLNEVRLRSAAAELATGWPTLRQVARRAGYDTDASFAKAFKRRFGVAPGVYRQIAKEPPQVEISTVRAHSGAAQ